MVEPETKTNAGRTLRVASTRGIEALLGRFGLGLAPLLAEAGLPPDCYSDPENRVPVDRLLHLIALAADLSNCPHFGLLLAEPVQPTVLGAPVVRLLAGAPSVERALRGLIMNLHLNGEAVVPALTVGAEGASLSITPYAYHPRGTDQLEDYSLVLAAHILRFLCGPKWSPTRVTFAHREPADRTLYNAFFKVPLGFGAPVSAVASDASWLSKRPAAPMPPPLPAAPSSVVDLDIAVRARRAVIGGLAQGIVGVDGVACAMGISKRTLNRRLAERGTSTKELIAEVRIQIAQQLLRDTDLTVADIAATICYSDAAAFSRAFSARVGRSPAAWRNSGGDGAL